MTRPYCLALCLLLWAGGPGGAAEPFRFPEGKHGKGELKYVNGVPVLVRFGVRLDQVGQTL